MCGGIATGLGAMARRQPLAALAFNAGRIASYVALGMLAAVLVGGADALFGPPAWGRWLRGLTALLIAAVGLQLLTGWRVLAFIERAGGWAWRRVQPLAVRFASHPGAWHRLALGLCWGLLPCGLVYTLLLTAAASDSPGGGALVMLAFGVGTLPAMLGLTLAAPALSAFLADSWTRRLVGVGLILLAAWSAILLAGSPGSHH
jgi:sulfite exporter TauE/SafE